MKETYKYDWTENETTKILWKMSKVLRQLTKEAENLKSGELYALGCFLGDCEKLKAEAQPHIAAMLAMAGSQIEDAENHPEDIFKL
jgi:transcription initiation factor IIE alpha subunit